MLEETYNGFVRSGANLSDEDKELYRQYSTELSELSLRFSHNVLAATNAFTINITDPAQVAELPDFVRDGMAAEAQGPWRAGMDGDASGAELRPFHGVFDQPRAEGEALESQQLPLLGR